MTTTKAATAEWLDKKEAAAMLGVSVRRLEYRVTKGQVQFQYLPKQPRETAARVVYLVEDLQAILDGKPNQKTIALRPSREAKAMPDASLALVPARPPAEAEMSREVSLALALSTLRTVVPPDPPKPWLTLEEAAEYSGLPAAYLRRRALHGDVHGINVGQGRHAFWRFNRESLSNIT